MNNRPFISVIVPVYNSGHYIERCVNSILHQTMPDFELILINDGSVDNSGELCDQFGQLDNRVTVVHKKNEGAGLARNDGLRLARGNYVVFVDSDDFISSDYFYLLSKHDEDVVFIDVDGVNLDGEVVRKEYLSRYSSLDKDRFLRRQMTGNIPWGGVRKAVKREIIRLNNIKYSNHKVGEEAIYSFLVVYYAQRIGFINSPVYCYLQRPDSQSHSVVEDPWGEVALNLRKEVKLLGLYEKYAGSLNAFIFAAAAGSLYNISTIFHYNEFKVRVKQRYDKYLDDIDACFPIDYKSLSFKIRLFGYLFVHKLYLIAWALSKIKKYSNYGN